MALTQSVYDEPASNIVQVATDPHPTSPQTGVRYVRCGNVITVNVDTHATMNGSSWVNIALGLPRPKMETYGIAKQNSVDKMIALDLVTNGNLNVMGSGTDNILIRGSMTYITKD